MTRDILEFEAQPQIREDLTMRWSRIENYSKGMVDVDKETLEDDIWTIMKYVMDAERDSLNEVSKCSAFQSVLNLVLENQMIQTICFIAEKDVSKKKSEVFMVFLDIFNVFFEFSKF
jgi:hypothetical protein